MYIKTNNSTYIVDERKNTFSEPVTNGVPREIYLMGTCIVGLPFEVYVKDNEKVTRIRTSPVVYAHV